MPPTPRSTTPTFTIVLEPSGVAVNDVELPRITGILRREGVVTTATHSQWYVVCCSKAS